IPADRERPRCDAECRGPRAGSPSVRRVERRGCRLAAAAVGRAALLGRPALPRRLVLVAFVALVFAGSVAAAGGPVATVTQTLTGLDDIASGGFEPPDVQVAAGPGFVIEMVNLAERTWRTG